MRKLYYDISAVSTPFEKFFRESFRRAPARYPPAFWDFAVNSSLSISFIP